MNDNEDIFSKIRDGLIESNIVYKNEYVTAFEDINPSAPVHILIIPNIKIPTVNDVTEEHVPYLGNMILAASVIAKQKCIDENGYRLIINCNKHGGQEVFYIHMHLVGGCELGYMISLPNNSRKLMKKLQKKNEHKE